MIKVGEVSRGELNPKGYDLTKEQEINQRDLYYKINIVRAIRNVPMITTSGVRSASDHVRIYKEKGITPVPMGSKHLKGAAVDILDEDGSFMEWCEAYEHILERVRLWVERGTKGWVHLQSQQYGSYKPGGSMFFNA